MFILRIGTWEIIDLASHNHKATAGEDARKKRIPLSKDFVHDGKYDKENLEVNYFTDSTGYLAWCDRSAEEQNQCEMHIAIHPKTNAKSGEYTVTIPVNFITKQAEYHVVSMPFVEHKQTMNVNITFNVKSVDKKAEKDKYSDYIYDTDTNKLSKEEPGANVLYMDYNKITHKFGYEKPNNINEALKGVRNFINSYKNMTKKTKIEESNIVLPKDLKFTKKSNSNIYLAKCGFKFKASEEFKLYAKGIYTSGGESVETDWTTNTCVKDEEYKVKYYFMYNSETKILKYKVIFSNATNKLVETRGEDIDEDDEEYWRELSEGIKKAEMRFSILSDEGEDRRSFDYKDVLTDTDFYSNVGGINTTDAEKVEDAVGNIIAIITNIGIVVSILVPAILGVKYMIGSVEEKAEYKKDMIPYFVGAVMLFAICTIVKIIQFLGQEINKI